MFEDDDYCRRVDMIDMKVACAEDVFVHHEHSASFNELASGPRRALFEANRVIYERKWGPWIPHTYRREG
jgi:GT2 family glycosyltransferase